MNENTRYVPRHVSGNKKVSNMKIQYFIPFMLFSTIIGFYVIFNVTPLKLFIYGLLEMIVYFGLMEFEREIGFIYIKDSIYEVIPREIIYEGRKLDEHERVSIFVKKGETINEDLEEE